MSSAPYVVYEPTNRLPMVQGIECRAKAIAEIRKCEKSSNY